MKKKELLEDLQHDNSQTCIYLLLPCSGQIMLTDILYISTPESSVTEGNLVLLQL